MQLHELKAKFAELTEQSRKAENSGNAMPAAARPLAHAAPSAAEPSPKSAQQTSVDPFLTLEDLVSVKTDALERAQKRVLAEIEELIRENRFADVKALFYPVEEKQPELAAHSMGIPVRAKVAFALGRVKCFDEAIQELTYCIQQHPDHFLNHSSLAYTAYDSLYCAKNREIFLSGKARADRIALAHTHFRKAQELRPEGVTNFYRQAMLYKQIEDKPEKAAPLFEQAVAHWEALDDSAKKERHQEQKNYVKALYELAACRLHAGNAAAALDILKKCMAADESANYISLMFKYFALGKVYFHLNRFNESKDALMFALQTRPKGQPDDFVNELLARTWLALDNPVKAMEIISHVPENRRRPYVRWTEAEICCAMGNIDKARHILAQCQEKDRMSRHKTLIRLARIEYLNGNYQSVFRCAAEADRFFCEKWGNHYDEGLFWQALAAFRLGDRDKALKLALQLETFRPFFPKLKELMNMLTSSADT
jgi:tetratricopeptide (TPR) repeat protein